MKKKMSERQAPAPKKAAKYMDAMALRDGYLSSKVPPEEIFACNAKYSTLEGEYEMEKYAAMKGKSKSYEMEEED